VGCGFFARKNNRQPAENDKRGIVAETIALEA
jgi:hypothetical protein